MQTNGLQDMESVCPGLLRDTGYPQLPPKSSKTKASGLLAVTLTKPPRFTHIHTHLHNLNEVQWDPSYTWNCI